MHTYMYTYIHEYRHPYIHIHMPSYIHGFVQVVNDRYLMLVTSLQCIRKSHEKVTA